MSDGCTSCGNKGGCDARKHAMFAAIDDALARLYPSRRWSERDDEAAFEAGLDVAACGALAAAFARALHAAVLLRPGRADETCHYVYVLCLGRPPSLIELRESALPAAAAAAVRGALGDGPIDEVYLRVALSTVASFAAVQEVRLSARDDGGGGVVLTEAPRAGVFDPALLARLRTLVAVLAAHDIRHLDFGDIVEPPAGFDAGDYAATYGGAPGVANYLFYPQPPAAITTTFI